MSAGPRQPPSTAGRRGRVGSPPNPIERQMSKFLREPPSVRTAASVIVTATALVVVGGGIAIRLLDHTEYKDVWVGMWWALQTVTTVGYGDVTPAHRSGRIVAAFVMLEGVAFLTITTAAITSAFVARAQNERIRSEAAAENTEVKELDARLDEMSTQLKSIESIVRRLDGSS
jgi:voltage-gated potassium channel